MLRSSEFGFPVCSFMTYDPSSILRSYVGLDFTSLSLYRDLLSRPSTKPKKKKGERQVENGSRTRSAGRSDRLYGVWGVTSHLPGYRAPIDRDFTSLWSTLRSFPLEVLQNPSHHPKNMSPLVCLSSSLRWLSISSPTFSTPCMYVYIDILHQE